MAIPLIIRSAFMKNTSLGLPGLSAVRAFSSPGGPTPFTTLSVSQPATAVTHVELHRPEKRNAMNKAFCREMVECFTQIAGDPDCRVVVSGAGKVFTAGVDFIDMASEVLQAEEDDMARISWNMRRIIAKYQETFTCPKPVVVACHVITCVLLGVDLITACDICLCTQDAWFQVKEVDIGLAADVGTLQRQPKVIGSRSWLGQRRKMYTDEAKETVYFPDKEALMAGALEMAGEIAGHSPVAVQGTKVNLIYSRHHSGAEGLNYMGTWNMSMLQKDDVMKSAVASMEKKSPKTITFSKL
uniref:Enoyl CoA hydratase 1, peroxisomal n=1 Tax=Salmo trutta TaxID=8032 RepID=A0A674CSV5_SALTR